MGRAMEVRKWGCVFACAGKKEGGFGDNGCLSH